MTKAKPKKKSRTAAPSPGYNVPPGVYDYAGKCGLKMDPDVAEFLNKIMAEDPKELAFQLEREVEQQASKEFEELAVQLRAEDEERRRLWGNKFPPVRGMTPEDLQDTKRKGVRLRPIPFYRKNMP